MYYIEFPVGEFTFGMTGETVDEVLVEFEQAGGDGNKLAADIESMVPDLQSGKLTFRATVTEAASRVTEPADRPRGHRSEPERDDQADPWTSGASAEEPSEERSEPRRGFSGRAARDSGSSPVTKTDRWGGQWTLNLPDAPMCDHGEPAARVKAKSGPNSKRPGTSYTVWKCAKGAPDGDWQNKCAFSEFPPR